LGIEHAEATQKARDAGLQVVQNKCLKVEYRNRQR
jgi:predicted CoA-binding protein